MYANNVDTRILAPETEERGCKPVFGLNALP